MSARLRAQNVQIPQSHYRPSHLSPGAVKQTGDEELKVEVVFGPWSPAGNAAETTKLAH